MNSTNIQKTHHNWENKLGLVLFLGILFTPTHSFALDFAAYLQNQQDIPLEVTGVASNDHLNLREQAKLDSKVIYKIPANAQNLISFDSAITKKVGQNLWVPIRLGFDEGYMNGYVKAKYIRLLEDYETLHYGKHTINKPYFLEHELTKQSLNLVNQVAFNHYSGCDMRDNPQILTIWENYKLSLQSFTDHRAMLLQLFDYDRDNILNYHDPVNNWFPNQQKTAQYFEPITINAQQGYKYTMGAEGCGINYYFFKKGHTIWLATETFDHNLPIPANKMEVIPKSWDANHKKQLTSFFLKQLLSTK